MTLANKKREHLQSFSRRKTFSAVEVAKALGLSDVSKVNRAFGDFYRRGEIERVSRGRYRYRKIQLKSGIIPVIKQRMLRAMHITGCFTIRKIAMLAEADRKYVTRVVRTLVKEGGVEQVGKKKNIQGAMDKVFRVRNRDAFYLKHVPIPGADDQGNKKTRRRSHEGTAKR